MGQHTNELIGKVNDALKGLERVRENLDKTVAALTPVSQARNTAYDAMQAYYVAHGWDGQKPTREQEMDSDQNFKALERRFEEELQRVMILAQQIESAKAVCRAARKEVETPLKALEAYITKKEAEKSWWQKTSVRSAKQFIASARAALA